MRTHLSQIATLVLRFELPVVVIATLASIGAASLLPLSVWVIGLLLLIRALQSFLSTGRLQIGHSPADVPIAVLCTTLVINLWATPRIDITLPQILRVFTGIGLFLALVNSKNLIAKQAKSIVTLVAVIGVVLALSMPFTVEWIGASKLTFIPSSLYQGFTLVLADGINPNVMAGAIVLFLPVALAGAMRPSHTIVQKVLFALATVVMAAGLVLAGSRSALLAAVTSGFAILLIHLSRRVIAVFLCLLGLAALVTIAMSRFIEPQFTGFINGLLTTNDVLSGSHYRMEIWSRAIYIIQDFPLTGIGMGLFAQVTDLLYPMIFTRPGIEHAHNLLLQVAVDVGLPGLVAWLAIYIVAIVCLTSQISRRQPDANTLVIGLYGAHIALIFGGITDAVTWGMVRSAPLVWGLWGLAVASWLSTSQHGYRMD